MSWSDTILTALNEVKYLVCIDEEDESKDAALKEVLIKLWAAARQYDLKWDED